MVSFHPSYAYEDFVEGLRPVLMEHGREPSVEIQPVDGALKHICDRARRDPDRRYALVIDEINRGNIAKIFGELITLIADKRTRYDADGQLASGQVQAGTLALLPEPFGGARERGPLRDHEHRGPVNRPGGHRGLRRRFIFREVLPQPGVIPGARGDGLIDPDDDGNPIDLRRLLQVINARLTVLRGRDACIGHAYLTAVTDIAGLRAAFRDRHVLLLREHFEDWGQIAQVLSVHRAAPRALAAEAAQSSPAHSETRPTRAT
ncbi:MAG: hypothetical protein MZU91_12935 [Desulfosudis oleivorans]|nr:hypothetical protein [Desulfosudis oleivorans]